MARHFSLGRSRWSLVGGLRLAAAGAHTARGASKLPRYGDSNRLEDSTANTSVFGIYSTQEQAAEAVDRMKADGFRNADISVLRPDGAGSKDLGMRKHGKALQGAAKGGAIGIVVGGVLGWLAGSGLMAIPMLAPMVAAGPILAVLSGAGVGAIIGGITGTLIGLGVPEYEAKRYQGRTRSGGILLVRQSAALVLD